MSFLQRFLDPNARLREMPPPHKSARVYSFAESVVLQRNAEQMRRQSRDFHKARSAP